MRRSFSGLSALTFFATAACQQVPTGPTASEGLYNSLVTQCNVQGGRDHRRQNACAQANSLAVQVSAERVQRDAQVTSVSQNNALATGLTIGGAALLGGAILGNAAAHSNPYYYYHHW